MTESQELAHMEAMAKIEALREKCVIYSVDMHPRLAGMVLRAAIFFVTDCRFYKTNPEEIKGATDYLAKLQETGGDFRNVTCADAWEHIGWRAQINLNMEAWLMDQQDALDNAAEVFGGDVW